jgi:PadR family transcriptional regulator, regulatory protein AphA
VVSTPPLELNPVSYVVLGLLARDGPSTSYEVKVAVGRGIAAFWPFPRSQIYAETERLARAGLLVDSQEETGRRRRVFRITRSGLAALRGWLAEPDATDLQIRSLGLLKLFFGQFAEPEELAALAAAQLAMLADLFERYDGVLTRLRERGDRPWQLAVAELLLAVHRAMARHWRTIERHARGTTDLPLRARVRRRARTPRAGRRGAPE